MDLFDSELPLKWCGWCQNPHEATSVNFGHHPQGRYGLQSICRACQNEDRKHGRLLRRLNPKEDWCSCGNPATDLDHCHTTGEFRAYVCRACNLANRRGFISGKRW